MLAKDRLITALDFDNLDKAKSMITTLGDSVEFYKVGLELFLNSRGMILDFLAEKNKKIFLDLKFHDIPNTTAAACSFASGLESVHMFNIHASGGHKMIQESVVKKRPDQILLAVTVLTSLDDSDIKNTFHSTLPASELALNLAILSKEAGASGVVCSAHEASKIKQSCGVNFITVCPGIRLSSTNQQEANDQKRILDPKEAIKNGADYIVVGRPIISAENPKQIAEYIIEEIEKA